MIGGHKLLINYLYTSDNHPHTHQNITYTSTHKLSLSLSLSLCLSLTCTHLHVHTLALTCLGSISQLLSLQIPELIRFVCCVIHPTNEVLVSDIIPRWALIGWLLSLCQGNSVVFINAKLNSRFTFQTNIPYIIW